MNKNTVLIIGFVWPEPNSSAAGKRMLQLIDFFLKWNYKIVFASTALENTYNFDLKDLNIQKVNIKLNSDSFDEMIAEINPQIVLFDRFTTKEQFGWRVSKNCPNAFKILDSEDLHCLRHTRAKKLKLNEAFRPNDLFSEDLTKREIASILRCDLTLIIAEYEMELLQNVFKIDPKILFYLPILFTEEELYYKSSIGFENRTEFIFIGNFWHEPNWDAVLYLKKEIWPRIKAQLPHAALKIYGAYPSQKVFDLQNKNDRFWVLGRAENAQNVIENAKVLLAPLRFGAGIKGKLLEAMQFGTPSVTSSIGAESINGELNWNGYIADDPEEFANQAVDLYGNKISWQKAQENGWNVLKNRFKREDFEQKLKETLENLLDNLHLHRENNFIGLLLSHHFMKSTEYMSRWIQEKNKNQ